MVPMMSHLVQDATTTAAFKKALLTAEEIATLKKNLSVYSYLWSSLVISFILIVIYAVFGLTNKILVQGSNIDVLKWLHRYNA